MHLETKNQAPSPFAESVVTPGPNPPSIGSPGASIGKPQLASVSPATRSKPALFMRRRDVVKITGIPYGQIDRLLKAEVLPSVKVGGKGRRLYRREDVERVFQIKL